MFINEQSQIMKIDNSLDNLEEVLTSTRYSLIDGMKLISESLSKEKLLQKINQQRFNAMKKKVFSLQSIKKKQDREVFEIQNKLNKLSESQDYAGFLVSLKARNDQLKQIKQQQRKAQCKSMRQSNHIGIQKSKLIYQKRREVKLAKIRQQDAYYQQQYFKNLGQLEKQKLQRKRQVKEGEIMMKERLRRYQQFKINQGKQYYQNKRKQEIQLQNQKSILLTELQKQAQKEIQVYRKTQFLENQANRIQSLYLTGTQPQ